jgi:biotin transport system substrate-specific component
MPTSRTRSITTTALLVALLAVSAWIVVPIGAVPVTLQTLVVVLIALVRPPRSAAAAVGAYLALGAIGVPVFSAGQGGLAALVGPTGGYLAGFLPAAVAGALVARPTSSSGRDVLAHRGLGRDALAATLVLGIIYALGVMWLAYSTGRATPEALAVGVVPFLVPDAAKATAAVVAARALRRAGM